MFVFIRFFFGYEDEFLGLWREFDIFNFLVEGYWSDGVSGGIFDFL